MENDKTMFYIVAIVAIVAVAGMIVMVAGNSGTKYASTTSDEAGQAIKSIAKTAPGVVRLNITCTDSDGGIDYFVFGSGRGFWPSSNVSELEYDRCKDNDNLDEIYCGSDNYFHFVEYNCPFGCTNGTCRIKPACTDSDNGINYIVAGTTVGMWVGSTTYETEKDFCTNTTLTEMFCGGGNYINYTQYKCPNGCINGACRKFPIADIKD